MTGGGSAPDEVTLLERELQVLAQREGLTEEKLARLCPTLLAFVGSAMPNEPTLPQVVAEAIERIRKNIDRFERVDRSLLRAGLNLVGSTVRSQQQRVEAAAYAFADVQDSGVSEADVPANPYNWYRNSLLRNLAWKILGHDSEVPAAPTAESTPGDGAPAADDGLTELYFGFVRAVGTNVKRAQQALRTILEDAHFRCVPCKLSEEIERLPELEPVIEHTRSGDAFTRYHTHMLAGDLLRSLTQKGDAVALLAVEAIVEQRLDEHRQAIEAGKRGVAYLLPSLMHPAEVRLLRSLYGSRFFVISVFSDETTRRSKLDEDLDIVDGDYDVAKPALIDHLLERDRGRGYGEDSLFARVMEDEEKRLPLMVDRTFDMGDLFVDVRDELSMADDIKRFVSQILGSPRGTPTRDELGMAHAYTARLRSGAMGRAVGAAVCSRDGKVLATGTNETAKFGGGQYWAEDPHPNRDIDLEFDISDQQRRGVFADLVDRLLVQDSAWLEELGVHLGVRPQPEALSAAINAALASDQIRDAEFFDIIEYGRPLHAEMAAITDAALRGITLAGATLYVTTFPCHHCAPNIVAAGITRVVYVEPYPKSRVGKMFAREIELGYIEPDRTNSRPPGSTDMPSPLADALGLPKLADKVRFEPFMGITPPRQHDLYSWVNRKVEDRGVAGSALSGEMVAWTLQEWETLRPSLGTGAPAAIYNAVVHARESELLEDWRETLSSDEARQAFAVLKNAREELVFSGVPGWRPKPSWARKGP